MGGKDYDMDAGFCYSQLSKKEKKIYDKINEGLLEFEEEISGLGGFEFNDFDKIFQGVLADHPEYFWVSDSYSYYSDAILGGDKVTKLLPQYTILKESLSDCQSRLDELTSLIVANSLAYSDIFGKIAYIHDYIVSQVNYNDDGDLLNSTAYGALINRKAICSGYSKAFQYLLTKVGVDCAYVIGKLSDGQGHAWNLVMAGSESFYMDVTLDDPLFIGVNNSGVEIYYNYFGLTDEEINKTHEADDRYDYPKCESESYNYYKNRGLYLTSADVSRAEQIIKGAYSNGRAIAVMKFSDIDYLNTVKSSLFDGQRIYSVIPIKSVSYSVDQTYNILIIRVR